GKCIIPGLPTVGSFHPNASGHSSGYAAAIKNYINAATTRTPEGYPADPAALPDPPTTLAVPTDVVQTLVTQPVTQTTADCEGTYQAGEQVSVSGGGFAPGASVQLVVSSPGLGSTGDQQTAQVTADASGNIAATMRIPLTATGFTPS